LEPKVKVVVNAESLVVAVVMKGVEVDAMIAELVVQETAEVN
jgi:hypothetical protein